MIIIITDTWGKIIKAQYIEDELMKKQKKIDRVVVVIILIFVFCYFCYYCYYYHTNI